MSCICAIPRAMVWLSPRSGREFSTGRKPISRASSMPWGYWVTTATRAKHDAGTTSRARRSKVFPSTRASSLLLPKRRAFPAAMTMQPIFIGSHPFLLVICSYLFSPTRRRAIRPRAGICSTRIISSACAPCQAIPSRGHRLREPRDRKCPVIGARHKNLFL